MTDSPTPSPDLHSAVSATFASDPLVGVVRTPSTEEAEHRARLFIAGGIRLVEITFTVPGATDLVRKLLAERDAVGSEAGPAYRVGMGTATTGETSGGENSKLYASMSRQKAWTRTNQSSVLLSCEPIRSQQTSRRSASEAEEPM